MKLKKIILIAAVIFAAFFTIGFCALGADTECVPEPSQVTAVNAKSGIRISWENSSGASYNLRRKEKGGQWQTLAKGLTCSSYTDKTAVQGVKYYYAVRAVKGSYKSSYVKTQYIYRLVSPNVKSVKNTADGVKITWEKADSAKGYIVYRSKDGSSWERIAKLKSGSTLTYTDKKAYSGVKYTYCVKSYRDTQKSAGTSSGKSLTCLRTPKSFELNQDGKKITLTWKKSDGASKYEIYMKKAGGEWTKLDTVKSDKTSYTYKLSSISKKVCFKVRALKGNTKSAFTEALCIRCVDSSKPMVALTYDDGPHPTNTNRILDCLEKNNARATFFVVGSRIEEYSSCLTRADNLGCEIGNHTYSHISLSSSSESTILSEVSKTSSLIKKYTGKTCKLIRAPGGTAGKALKIIDMPFIYWSIDTRDWESRSCSSVVSIVKNQVRDGSIILMHDLYSSTAEASEILIPWLIKNGYQLVTVSEMMEAKGISMASGTVYYHA